MKKTSSFVARFNLLLSKTGKSDSSLAADLGYSKQAVSSWKNGIRSPRKSAVMNLANYFGVDEIWLMGYDIGDYPYSTAFRENLQSFVENTDREDITASAENGAEIDLIFRVINSDGPLTLDSACKVVDILGTTVDAITQPMATKKSAQSETGRLNDEIITLLALLPEAKRQQAVDYLRFLAESSKKQ